MAIIFGSDAGIRPDLHQDITGALVGEFNRIKTDIEAGFNRLTGQSAGLPPLAPLEPVHVDDGFSNVPGTAFTNSTIDNIDDIQKRRIVTQEPHITVYLKKRAFWSLRDEYSSRFMDGGEKLFIRASKILFEKKASQIAAYEALTKLDQLIANEADIDSAGLDAIVSLLERASGTVNFQIQGLIQSSQTGDPALNAAIQDEINQAVDNLESTENLIESLRELSAKNKKTKQATQTNWVVDPDDADVVSTGRGSGVIELTAISDLNTSLGLESEGSFSFTLQDPYNLTKITSDDVEIALSSAFREAEEIGVLLNSSEGRGGVDADLGLGPAQLLEEARRKDRQLQALRKNKVVNVLGFNQSPSVLSNNDTAEIIFEIQPTSVSTEKVTASTPAVSTPFNKNTFRSVFAQLPAGQQLSPREDQLVTEIFKLLERYVAAVERINRNALDLNNIPDFAYARRQLRKHFLGKSMVQPMDGVHIYINGRTRKDGEVIGPLNYLLNNTAFIKEFADSETLIDQVIEEEMDQFNIDRELISVELYKSIRTSGLLRNAGVHVFGGLVSTVSESYNASNGNYVLNVSGHSNLKWLRLSRVNVKPSLDQTQGLLEDPLTPFDIKTDPNTGLIEGEPGLSDINREREREGLLNYNAGIRPGGKVKENNLVQDYEDSDEEAPVQKIRQHAPGLVYKWKEGIIVATRNVNLKTALDGSPHQSSKLRRDVGLTITESPFANQDAADVVSLLVTGFPHNYESFFENATATGAYSPGGTGGSNDGQSYFHTFFDVTRSTNRALGNFQPFKILNVPPDELEARINAQMELRKESKKINELRKELANLQDLDLKLRGTEGIKISEESERKRGTAQTGLTGAIRDVKARLTAATNEFKQNANNAPGLRVYGSDFALQFEPASSSEDARDLEERNQRFALKNRLLQLRTQFDCKFNRDQNLFIVSDEYDKDLDIQAYVLASIGSQDQPIWKSDYKVPLEICRNVAKTLDFEFFCDSQGHIQFRPPKYNRVPLSLLLKLFLLEARENKVLFPTFLKNLFNTTTGSIERDLEIVNKQLKLESILLNTSVSFGENDPTNELVIGVGESIQLSESLAPTSELQGGDLREKAKSFLQTKVELASLTGGKAIDINDQTEIEAAEKLLREFNDPSSRNVSSRRLSKFNKIGKLISRRQQLTAISSRIKSEGETLVKNGFNKVDKDVINKLFKTFGELIEDDFHDFLGPGSASRFIIYDEQIISSSFTESDQNVICRVDVQGQQDLTGDKAGEIGQVPVLWAGGTDFDLWRQYGYRPAPPTSKPFFKNAETQCAPYVMMLLNRAKRDIVRGSITLYGNEYYQIGEVVYINNRDMLFYVSDVSHSFSYSSGSYTTKLELRYGHPLGEYLATPLDVIGKNIIRNQTEFNRTVMTRDTSDQKIGVHIGAIVFPSKESAPSEEGAKNDMLSGLFALTNVTSLKNALTIAKKHVGKNGEFPKVEIRGYITDAANVDKVRRRMKAVRNWFKNPIGKKFMKEGEGFIKLSSLFTDSRLQENQLVAIDSNTSVDPINIKEELTGKNLEKLRIPKEEVFSAAPDGKPDNIIEAVLVYE